MDTLGQWKSFPFEDRKRGEKARQPELNCDGTQCVKVCANTSSADFAALLKIWDVGEAGHLSAYCTTIIFCNCKNIYLFQMFAAAEKDVYCILSRY